MKKLIYLICLVFTLVSCSNNKNTDTEFIDSQVEDSEKMESLVIIEEENIKTNIKVLKDDYIKNNANIKDKEDILQDFGEGLILKNNNESEILYFNNEIIFIHNTKNSPKTSWYESKNKNFIVISKNGRVTVEKNYILDINKSKIYELPGGNINQIEQGKSGIFLLLQSPGTQEIIFIDTLGDKKNIIESKVMQTIENSPEVIFDINLYSFELMLNKKVKIFYNEGSKTIDDEKQEIILDLDNTNISKQKIFLEGNNKEIENINGTIKNLELSKISPYKELFDIKGWKLNDNSTNNNWSYTDLNGDNISIYYKGSPFPGGKTTFKINNLEVIDLNECIEFEVNPINESHLGPKCLTYYNGFSFNGEVIEHDFKNSMSNILISKTDNKISLFEGKLIIDFKKNIYIINDEYLKLNKGEYEGFISLVGVY